MNDIFLIVCLVVGLCAIETYTNYDFIEELSHIVDKSIYCSVILFNACFLFIYFGLMFMCFKIFGVI